MQFTRSLINKFRLSKLFMKGDTFHPRHFAIEESEFELINHQNMYSHKLSNDHITQGLLCSNTTVVHGNGR